MRVLKPTVVRLGIVCLVLTGVGAICWILSDRSARPTDFSQDYFAATVMLRGGSIYGPEVAALGTEHFGKGSPANFHPPTLAPFFVPFAWLPYRLAYVLFGLLNIGLFAASVVLTTRAVSTISGRSTQLLAALFWWPFWACLTHGQVSMLVAACLTASWLCNERKRPVAAGAFAGLAVLVKLFPALIALYFLIRRDWRALISMVLVIACGVALAWFTVGPEDILRYVSEAAPESADRWSSHPLNVSLLGALQVLLGDLTWGTEPLVKAPEAARALAGLLGAAIVAVTSIRGLLFLRHTALGARRLFAGSCIAALLLSPLTWSHTLVVAVFPLIVEITRPQSARGRLLILAVAFLLIGFPGPPVGRLLAPVFAGGLIPWYAAAVFQAPAIGLVILWWRLIGERD